MATDDRLEKLWLAEVYRKGQDLGENPSVTILASSRDAVMDTVERYKRSGGGITIKIFPPASSPKEGAECFTI